MWTGAKINQQMLGISNAQFLHLISPENALEAKCITCGENRTYVRKNLSITINRWFKLSIPLNGGL